MPAKIEKTKLLLVEGKDEIYFFDALLEHINIKDIQLIEVKGKNNFKNEFPILLKSPKFDDVLSYGIIQDADKNANNTFQSVVTLLSKHNQPIPKEHGEFKSNEIVKTGVFIMPDNQNKGMLEDLCLKTVSNHPNIECVNQYLDCLKNNKSLSIKNSKYPKNLSKAKVHTFLAGMEKYTSSLGVAAKKGYFNLDSKYLKDIIHF